MLLGRPLGCVPIGGTNDMCGRPCQRPVTRVPACIVDWAEARIVVTGNQASKLVNIRSLIS